jgi:hypothetical protein
LFAIDVDNGSLLWQRPLDARSQTAAVDAAERIIVTEVIPIRSAPQSPPDKFDFQFVWLDPATGAAQQVAKVEGMTRSQSFFGPWITQNGGVLALAAPEQNSNPDARDIVRLEAAGAAVNATPESAAPSIWLSRLPRSETESARRALAKGK